MATKNLARTAIEGGRTNVYKEERDQYIRAERHATKQHLHLVTRDPELYDEGEEPQEPLSKLWNDEIFNDRLSAVGRWMEKQEGKNWNKTYSKLRESFDSRTTAGRHILFDHLLNSVTKVGNDHDWYREYEVDEQGVLRKKNERYHRSRWNTSHDLPRGVSNQDVCDWLDGRQVGSKDGGALFWFVPTFNRKMVAKIGYWGVTYGFADLLEPVYPIRPRYLSNMVGSYRQAKRLNKKELEFFNSLPERLRSQILAASPVAPLP